ncbi:MAG: heparinase II/III family protein, partial [Coriobacteriaceae bacterium]
CLKRFSPDDIVRGRIELLNCGVSIDWGKPWLCEEMSALWKFNLHYCEFVLPLAKAACGAGSDKYVEGGKDIISSWISVHPRSAGGAPWDPYVISMRVANWLAFYGEARDAIDGDEPFLRKFNDSLYEQYCHLSVHLEKDILANHYLENLKAMILLAAYFDDAETLHLTVSRFVEQIGEQILSDGMHFELFPPKIMLECLMRVAGVSAPASNMPAALFVEIRWSTACTRWKIERTPFSMIPRQCIERRILRCGRISGRALV